jgi:hypothetical protein
MHRGVAGGEINGEADEGEVNDEAGQERGD